MSVFGPFYPADLQTAVNHAERFARAVARTLAELPFRRGAPTPVERSRAEVWLLGRADEIEAFVGAVVDDWRAGRLNARRGAVMVDRYVLDLHRGYVAFARGGQAPPCCRPCEPTVEADVV